MSINLTQSDGSTGRTITPNQDIPPLELPAGSLSPGDRDYEYVHSQPATVSELEHKIRCALMGNRAPPKQALLKRGYDTKSDTSSRLQSQHESYVVAANQWDRNHHNEPEAITDIREILLRQYEEEQELWDKLGSADPESVSIKSATPFLKNRILECLEDYSQPHLQRDALADEQQNRVEWLANLILTGSVYKAFKQHTLGDLAQEVLQWLRKNPVGSREKQFSSVSFIGRVIVTDSDQIEHVVDTYSGVKPEDVVVISEYKDSVAKAIHEYDFTFPLPIVVGHFDTSRYPLVPWTGGLACTCPFKQQAPHRVTCKHEIATAWVLRSFGKMYVPITGCSIPARCQAFVDHQIGRNLIGYI